MGNRHDHLRFDDLLRDNGIINLSEYDCDQVHDRMDRDMYSHGGPWQHQENDPMHNEEGIKRWIRDGRDSFFDGFLSGLTFGRKDSMNVHGHKLSDFLKVCYGHIVLDRYWRNIVTHLSLVKNPLTK